MAARLLPNNAELRSNQGVALYCASQLQTAIAAFQRALAINPALVAPHLFLGLASYRLGDDTRAVQELQAALRLSPADKIAHLWLGYTYVAQEKFETAVSQFQAVLATDPKDPDAEYALGQCWLEIGRRKAQQLANVAPNGPFLLRLAAEQDELSGDSDGAHAALAEAAKREAARASATVGSSTQEESLYREAHEAEERSQNAFATVLRDAPDSYRAHQIMADINLVRQQLGEAIAEYRKVLQLNPGLPGVHESISNCLMREYRPAEALAELRSEQKLQPRSAQVLTEIARVQSDMDDQQGATNSLEQAVKFVNPPAAAYLLLGKLALRRGDPKAAITALQVAIAKDAKASGTYYLLASAYRATGDRTQMTETLRAFRQVSEDERERKMAERAIQNPDSPPPVLDSHDESDAKALVSAGP